MRIRPISSSIQQCIVLAAGLTIGLTAFFVAAAPVRPSGFLSCGGADGRFTVDVLGSEYRWQFQRPGPDGLLHTEDDPPATGVLVVPPGVDVRLNLKSADYVYVMTLPELNVKQICVPGLNYSLSFRTPAAGKFEMPVGNLCGVSFLHEGPMGMLQISTAPDTWRQLGCRP